VFRDVRGDDGVGEDGEGDWRAAIGVLVHMEIKPKGGRIGTGNLGAQFFRNLGPWAQLDARDKPGQDGAGYPGMFCRVGLR